MFHEDTHIKIHCNQLSITHPTHPLRGKSYEVIPEVNSKHPELVKIRLLSGEQRIIPLSWTDKASPIIASPGGYFLPANLVTLRQRVDDLLSGQTEGETIPAQSQDRGGRNEIPKTDHPSTRRQGSGERSRAVLATTERATTTTGAQPAGADGNASMDARGE